MREEGREGRREERMGERGKGWAGDGNGDDRGVAGHRRRWFGSGEGTPELPLGGRREVGEDHMD